MTRMPIGRRTFAVALAGLGGATIAGWGALTAAARSEPQRADLETQEGRRALYEAVVAEVLPRDGFQSRVALQGSVPSLVRYGVIAPPKLAARYGTSRGAVLPSPFAPVWWDLLQKFAALDKRPPVMPPTLRFRLQWPSLLPIRLTRETANDYVTLLWPLGLANRMESNERSPIAGDRLFGFASTGGWTLGAEANGGAYFNRFPIVPLSPDQEALATGVAETTFRPCCNNSTFFQDCNHGSALLGLLELAAAQGLSEDELYREALGFNAFWFPDTYVKTALYFRIFEGVAWRDVDPRLVMSAEYSAIGPWQRNVMSRIATVPDLIPPPADGVRCGV